VYLWLVPDRRTLLKQIPPDGKRFHTVNRAIARMRAFSVSSSPPAKKAIANVNYTKTGPRKWTITFTDRDA
jgi:hypothetical protein